MAKKKGPKKVKVKASKAHRRRGTWVKGYWRNRSKPHRNKTYSRNRRRTKKEIALKGTRKEQRKRNVSKYHYNKPKPTRQARLG